MKYRRIKTVSRIWLRKIFVKSRSFFWSMKKVYSRFVSSRARSFKFPPQSRDTTTWFFRESKKKKKKECGGWRWCSKNEKTLITSISVVRHYLGCWADAPPFNTLPVFANIPTWLLFAGTFSSAPYLLVLTIDVCIIMYLRVSSARLMALFIARVFNLKFFSLRVGKLYFDF